MIIRFAATSRNSYEDTSKDNLQPYQRNAGSTVSDPLWPYASKFEVMSSVSQSSRHHSTSGKKPSNATKYSQALNQIDHLHDDLYPNEFPRYVIGSRSDRKKKSSSAANKITKDSNVTLRKSKKDHENHNPNHSLRDSEISLKATTTLNQMIQELKSTNSQKWKFWGKGNRA